MEKSQRQRAEAPASPHTSEPDARAREVSERAVVSALVAELRRHGERPEVQPAAVAPSPGATVAAHAGVGALASLAGLVWPFLALIGLLAVARSAWTELQGRLGWLRRFVPRRVGHNVILWGERQPEEPGRPCLLVVAPLDGGDARPPASNGLFAVLAAPAALSAAGLLLIHLPVLAEAGRALVLIGAGGLLLGALAGLVHAWREPATLDSGPAGHHLLAVRPALRERPPEHLDLVLALTSGGSVHADGLAVLLQNYKHRLSPERTRVLALVPVMDGLSFVTAEGRWRFHPADPLLAAAAAELGLPPDVRVTAASRAAELGFRSGALAVSPSASTAALRQVVAILDREAGGGRW